MSKYVDVAASLQVIGCILSQPNLLEDEGTYFFNEDDFPNEFHKVVFGCTYNLYQMGTKYITVNAIEEYLSNRAEHLGVYKNGNGAEWIEKAKAGAELENFEYNYQRMKKMTLLRGYDDIGLDMKWLYDPDNIIDLNKRKRQEDYLDSLELTKIADIIDEKILMIRSTHVDNTTNESIGLGDNIFETLARLKQSPEIGAPMYGDILNSITRGCILTKFYLWSAPQGCGKSRAMLSHACTLGVSRYWDVDKKDWKDNGEPLSTLFISTELNEDEVHTMALAFVSGVDENHILWQAYDFGEEERVTEAAKILSESKLRLECIADFSIRDIENAIKRNLRLYGCQYVFN